MILNRAYRYRIYPTAEQCVLDAAGRFIISRCPIRLRAMKLPVNSLLSVLPNTRRIIHILKKWTALRLLTSSWICRLPSVTVSVSRTRRILVFLSSSPQSAAAGLIPLITRRVLLPSWTAALSDCLRPVK